MRILIIRHADPDYSFDSLTPVGFGQADALKERLASYPIDAIYSSPFGRALVTASIATSEKNLPIKVLPWLREYSARTPKKGNNCVWDWLPQDWANDERCYDKDHWTEASPFEGKNNVKEEADWVSSSLDALLKEYGYVREGNLYRCEQGHDKTIALFCHFGVESILLGHLINASPMVLWMGTCATPSSITVIDTEERRKGYVSFRIEQFGSCEHLYAKGLEPSFSARFCSVFENDERHD